MIIKYHCCDALYRFALTDFWHRKSTSCLPDSFIHSPEGQYKWHQCNNKRCCLGMNVIHLSRSHALVLRLRHGSGENLRLQNSLQNNITGNQVTNPHVDSVLRFGWRYAISGLEFIWFDSSTLASHSVEQTLIRWAKDLTNNLPLKSGQTNVHFHSSWQELVWLDIISSSAISSDPKTYSELYVTHIWGLHKTTILLE